MVRVASLAALGLFCFGCGADDAVDDAPVWNELPASLATIGPVDCEEGSDNMPTERAERPHAFWAEDPALQASLGAALGRLREATGLDLELAPGGIEVIVTDLPYNVIGYASDHIDVDPDAFGGNLEAVLLHEMGHILGAGHLGPWGGIMSRCMGESSLLLTSADLMQICSAAPCATFQPEIP